MNFMPWDVSDCEPSSQAWKKLNVSQFNAVYLKLWVYLFKKCVCACVCVASDFDSFTRKVVMFSSKD